MYNTLWFVFCSFSLLWIIFKMERRLLTREYLDFENYDGKHFKMPLPKSSWWFTSRDVSHCVVSCSNIADTFYISDFGFVHMAYCDSDARSRILHTLITGELERGIWCSVYKGKLSPHHFYGYYLKHMIHAHPKQAKKLEEKLEYFERNILEQINNNQ